MDNAELRSQIRKVAEGDTAAFEHIYNALKTPVYTIAFRILQSQSDAEDATQEVFLKLFRSPADFAVTNPRAWLFQTVRNLSIDTLRKRKDCPEAEEYLPSSDESSFEQIARKHDIYSAFGYLTYSEREVVTLHVYGELTFLSISKIMKISLPAAYRLYRKSIKKLQLLLNGGKYV